MVRTQHFITFYANSQHTFRIRTIAPWTCWAKFQKAQWFEPVYYESVCFSCDPLWKPFTYLLRLDDKEIARNPRSQRSFEIFHRPSSPRISASPLPIIGQGDVASFPPPCTWFLAVHLYLCHLEQNPRPVHMMAMWDLLPLCGWSSEALGNTSSSVENASAAFTSFWFHELKCCILSWWRRMSFPVFGRIIWLWKWVWKVDASFFFFTILLFIFLSFSNEGCILSFLFVCMPRDFEGKMQQTPHVEDMDGWIFSL